MPKTKIPNTQLSVLEKKKKKLIQKQIPSCILQSQELGLSEVRERTVLSCDSDFWDEFGFFSEQEDLKASIWDWHFP